MPLDRAGLLADRSQSGVEWCRRHTELIDGWLADLFDRSGAPGAGAMALVAIGGYGRSELCPHSDIDVMLLHGDRVKVTGIADRIWYPIWDDELHLGHSVSTVKEALALAADDLDTATALLSARHLAGDESLTNQLVTAAAMSWEKRAKRWLGALAANVDARHAKAGEAAFLLEPDLKEGRGGMRDVHSLVWAEAAHRVRLEADVAELSSAYSVLLGARVELQRQTGRASNVLVLQEQPEVAETLGYSGRDELMAAIAEAARRIAWTSDDAWRRVTVSLRTSFRRGRDLGRSVADGVRLRDGEVALEDDDDPPNDKLVADDALLPLRLAVAAATHRASIERASLDRLAASAPALSEPWPAEARWLLADLLASGAAAVGVIEALDQRGVWERILPEWTMVRNRPQHNAYHRYTVDRHLLETVAQATRLAGRTERPDLLNITALLHDIGKACPGDHVPAGVELAHVITTRMGFAGADIDTVAALIQHHLLLPEVATSRDLDEPATVERVAEAVGSQTRLDLLAALTEADSLATGPSAWGPWKAELVRQLVERVAHVLSGGEAAGIVVEAFPSEMQMGWLRSGERRITAEDELVTVVDDDRPGLFSRVAGILALHGLDVMGAAAYSTDEGRALAEFRVTDPVRDETPWPRIVADLERALDGRLAVNARLAERARTYRSRRPLSGTPTVTAVHFDNHASTTSTVIDVHAPDRVGVLYRITRALAELDLDIRVAKAQTLGAEVIDSFYVREGQGAKLTEPLFLAEVERAILHSVAEED
ncbi:MAG TPA: [protein-PII] uridylyltransferase [Acidimicrobiales bacterium]